MFWYRPSSSWKGTLNGLSAQSLFGSSLILSFPRIRHFICGRSGFPAWRSGLPSHLVFCCRFSLHLSEAPWLTKWGGAGQLWSLTPSPGVSPVLYGPSPRISGIFWLRLPSTPPFRSPILPGTACLLRTVPRSILPMHLPWYRYAVCSLYSSHHFPSGCWKYMIWYLYFA